MLIIGSIVKGHDIIGIKTEFLSGDISPFLGEDVFAFVRGRKSRLPLAPAEFGVAVHEAVGRVIFAKVLEVWDELGDLETVKVIWEDEGSDVHVDDVGVGLAFDWRSFCHETFPDVMGVHGVWAEKIVENSDLNFSTWGTESPSWKGWHNWNWVTC